MPKLDLTAIPWTARTGYPGSLADMVRGRSYQRLTDPGGLSQFGVNLCRLEPGAASSIRHWHETEDEFAVMLEGELVLVEETSETILRPGDCAAFPAGAPNGHHFVNRTDRTVTFLVVGTRATVERVHYPDVDLMYVEDEAGGRYTHKDGAPY